MDDAAIHRVWGDANGFVYSFIESQWIATGLRPRDDKTRVRKRPEVYSPAPFSLFTLQSSLFH